MHKRIMKVWCVPACMSLAMTANTAVAQQDENTNDPVTHHYQLTNGTRVLHIVAPNAERQTTFTFLPEHFFNEPVDKAQWSHLIEHMMIRSTDPIGVETEGMTFNGETSHESLRLETIAEPDHWRESIEKHAAWLSASEIDAATLEREKAQIELEEQGTAANTATHKFAMAAWNQIVQHNSKYAAVHGNVADATLEDVNSYLQDHVHLNDSVLVATIGPVPAEDVRQDLEATIGKIESSSKKVDDTTEQLTANAKSNFLATWDLPTRHVIVWWDLPIIDDDSASTQAATAVLTAGGMMSFYQRPPTGLQPGKALVMSQFASDRCRIFVNCVIDDDTDVDALVANIRERIATMAAAQSQLQFFAKSLAEQLETMPDFESQRLAVDARYRPMIEAQWFLERAMQQFKWQISLEDIAAAFRSIDETAWIELKETFAAEPSGVLLLESVDEND